MFIRDKSFVLKTALCLVVVLLFTLPALAADWPTRLYDNHRGGITTEQLTLPLSQQWVHSTARAPSPAWPESPAKQNFGADGAGRTWEVYSHLKPRENFDFCFDVAAVGDYVYFGSSNGIIYALDSDTGKRLWAYDTDGAIEAPPLLVGTSVYIGSIDGSFYAIDSVRGKLQWTFQADAQITGSANYYQDSVFFGSYDGKVYSIDSETGALNWNYETEYFVNGTPALSQNEIIFGGCDAFLHIVSFDGEYVSKIDSGAYIAGSPVVSEGVAYIGNFGNVLLAIDLASGETLWEYVNDDERGVFYSSAAVSGDVVVIGSRDRRLHCVEKSTGLRKWVFETGGDIDGSPVIAGNRVVFGSNDGWLYMVRIADGTEVWTYEIGGQLPGSPALSDGKIYIGSEDGRLYAFGNR